MTFIARICYGAAKGNLAFAERADLDVLTTGTCCQGALRHAIRFLNEEKNCARE